MRLRNTRIHVGSVLTCAPLYLSLSGCVTIDASPPAAPFVVRACNGDHGYGPPGVTLGEPRPIESTPAAPASETRQPASPPSPTPAETIDPSFPPALTVPDLSPPTRQSWKPGRSS